MAKKKSTEKAAAKNQLKYKQIAVEITFTDGEKEMNNFNSSADCFRFIEKAVSEHYADSIRVELF